MYSDRFEITKYVVRTGSKISAMWGGQQVDAKGVIKCDGKEADIILYFVDNPDSYSPVVNIDKKTAVTFHDIGHMPIFMDMLRNEKPIFGYINSDSPESTMLATSIESVGEGEQ
jgi:hypothetical protein